jgi:hypothetical protein
VSKKPRGTELLPLVLPKSLTAAAALVLTRLHRTVKLVPGLDQDSS